MQDSKKTVPQAQDEGVSRRIFIKKAGMAAIGMGLAGCVPVATLPTGGAGPEGTGSEGEASGTLYDAVIIGTGMGGSAAGAIAAFNGLKTLILEKNPRPGGSCSYYERDGFRVDTGAHMFIQANRGPFGDLTRRLKMGNAIDFVQAANTLAMKGVGLDVTVSRDFFMRVLSVPVIALQAQINPLYYPSIAALIAAVTLMPPHEIEKLDDVPMLDFVNKICPNKETASMLAGLLGLMIIMPGEQASAGESIWQLQKIIYGLSVSYPKGGASAIPRTFLKGAEQYKAEVRMNAGVQKIEVKDGKVAAVILHNGERIRTRAVISTTEVKDTVLKLVGEGYFPAAYVNKVKSIIPSFTAVQAKIGLKKKLVNAGCFIAGRPVKPKQNIVAEFTGTCFENAAKGIQGEYVPIYAPVPTSFDKSLAPEGCQLITAVALAPTLDVPSVDGPDVWIDGMLDTLTQAIPELEEHMIFCDTWSIQRMADWAGKSSGSAISTAQIVGQAGAGRPAHSTPIKGLYLAGDCAGPARGTGTELACQSGMDCADLVTDDIKNALI